MAVYVLSDTHFRQHNICRFRPAFESMEDHDQVVVDNILNRCGKRDTLYLMGDVCIGEGSLQLLETISDQVEHLHIVLGNHDNERRGSPTIHDYARLCKGVYGLRKYKQAWFSHAPIHPDELRGRVNIHGHVHEASLNDERYINVSCEAVGFKPVNVESLWRTGGYPKLN